jgi:glycosyltransferase involved in cell wall biosynthesis
VSRIAYLANQFPSPVEPYVAQEIAELRRRGFQVFPGSIRVPDRQAQSANDRPTDVVILQSVIARLLVRAAWLCIRRRSLIGDLVKRVLFRGKDSLLRRIKALLHTWLGACYALALEGQDIEHIHVHHGYFGSWVAMVAARLLEIPFSMTLHGSDLLLHGSLLDIKLENCLFCLTVSGYNRRHILQHYPQVEAGKIIVARLGVEIPRPSRPVLAETSDPAKDDGKFTLLTVGRLHAVKDHAFLVQACAQLRTQEVNVECLIAGDGPERRRLQSLIRRIGVEAHAVLLGHVPHREIDSLYERADVVVLTSRSEGIPLVLMEAMARRKVVLAPDITGIPELVVPGKTGFLYTPGSMEDFVAKIRSIYSWTQEMQTHNSGLPSAMNPLDWVRHGARAQVSLNFNRERNLELFVEVFSQRIKGPTLDRERSAS